MISFRPTCPRGRENRVRFANEGQGRRVKFMPEGMDEPEDAGPAKVCSGIRGCVGRKEAISDTPPLPRPNSVVGLRGHVTDARDLEPGGLERADGGLAARAGTLHVD